MAIDVIDLICRLVGYLDGGMESPTFVMPVFIDLDTDKYVIQVTGSDDKIISFEPLYAKFETLVPTIPVIRKIGDDALFGVRIEGKPVVFQNKFDFEATISNYLDSGHFDDFPAFGLTVAKLLDSREKVGNFKLRLFNELSDAAVRTKKYFLENNIIRDELGRIMPIEYRPIVKNMKIDIRNNRIIIDVPDDTDGNTRQELGKKITDLFRKYTNSNSVDLSFDHSERQIKDIIAEISTIKTGRFDFNPEIFDIPRHCRYISMRESLIVVPDAAKYYYKIRRNASWAVNHLTAKKLPFEPLSMPTARKVVELETVSVISAMLFRAWTFGDVYEAKTSINFKLHVCCYRIKNEIADVRPALNVKEFLSSQSIYRRDFLLPISMITLMIREGVITKSDAFAIFEFKRQGRFWTYFITKTTREKWIDYCANFEEGLDMSIANEIVDRVFSEYLV